jgi:hypothetical protein
MNETDSKPSCPFCGSKPDRVRPDAARLMRAFALADTFTAFLHDANHQVRYAADALHVVRDAMGEGDQKDRAREYLPHYLERGEEAIHSLAEMMRAFSQAYRAFDEMIPVSRLPEEIKRICAFSRMRSDIDFGPLGGADSLFIDADAYLTCFLVCLTDCLMAMSRDRTPQLRITFDVQRTGVTTSFWLTHHGRLNPRDHGDWNRLRWCVHLAKGSLRADQHATSETSLCWDIPVTTRGGN